MAEIVNLRQARKAKQRSAAAVQGEANRARYGASKTERRLAQDEAERLARTVHGAKRESD